MYRSLLTPKTAVRSAFKQSSYVYDSLLVARAYPRSIADSFR